MLLALHPMLAMLNNRCRSTRAMNALLFVGCITDLIIAIPPAHGMAVYFISARDKAMARYG